MDAQLLEDPAAVRLDRAPADAKPPGDLLVGAAEDEEPEDLALARGQHVERGTVSSGALEQMPVHPLGREPGAEVSLAGAHFPDRGDDLLRLAVLARVSHRAGGKRLGGEVLGDP